MPNTISEKSIELLRQQAKTDEPLRDVLHMFSTKERSFRQGQMTLSGLTQRMNADGFEHSEKEYMSVIQKLADAGLGTLDKTPNGRILGLRHVNIVPKSLGTAVLEGASTLKPYKRRNKYINPPTPRTVETKPVVEVPEKVVTNTPSEIMIELRLVVKGRPLTVSIPQGMPAQDVAELIAKLSA